MKAFYITTAVLVLLVAGVIWRFQSQSFPLPEGKTVPVTTSSSDDPSSATETAAAATGKTSDVMVTDGTRHTIPLDEILSGGPGKDGIPSIDNPKFVSADEATFLSESDQGIGLAIDGESRFYPYKILVWHEIVNDGLADQPVLVTYCPLCATGIVFDRRVDGEVQEFGVSGRLWQSNLLMYNRGEDESLWSQVLGEAVVGPHAGEELSVVRSDIVRFGDWRQKHPNTQVLSRDTGASRSYNRDPYNGYYTSDSVSFGASFDDDRLHPKELVHGIEIDGQFKAYHDKVLSVGTTTDEFASQKIVVTKSGAGEVSFTANGEPITSIPGFWFSWLSVHPDTELYK